MHDPTNKLLSQILFCKKFYEKISNLRKQINVSWNFHLLNIK